MMSRLSPSGSNKEIERTASNWILRRDGGLTAEEEAEFARWRAADSRHAEAVARKEAAWSTLGRPLDAGRANDLLQRLAERAARRRRRSLGAAVASMLVLTAGFFSFQRFSAPAVVARGAVLQPESRTLEDGSVVELRLGAKLTVEFTAQRRLVRLAGGTAHFQVAENKARPFIVQAGDVEFRAVGTAFSVEVGSSQVELLVTQGRVAVDKSSTPDVAAPNDAAVPAAPVAQTLAQVDAGNRLVVAFEPAASAPTPTAISTDELSQRLAWRVPRLEFSELPLAEAVQLMNRYNRVQFVIRDSEVSRLRVSGLFRADNLDTFVRLLEGTCGIEAERAGDSIVLKKARR